MQCNPLIHLSLQSSHCCLFQHTVIVPHAHWEAYRCGSLPLHNLVSDDHMMNRVRQLTLVWTKKRKKRKEKKRKSRLSPDGQGDRGNHCVPTHRTAQILIQSKNSDNEVKQTMFHTENARILSTICPTLLFLPWTYASPSVVIFQGGHGKTTLLLGAVRALCKNTPKVPQYASNLTSPQPCICTLQKFGTLR